MNFAVTQMGSSKTKTHSANFNGAWEKPNTQLWLHC